LGSTVALVAIYYLLPLDRTSLGVAIGMLAVGLLALIGLVAFQARSIVRAAYPALHAVGALATSAPLFLLLFAGTYFGMGTISVGSFSEPMTRVLTRCTSPSPCLRRLDSVISRRRPSRLGF
jgi:voltage-gated potassium channel